MNKIKEVLTQIQQNRLNEYKSAEEQLIDALRKNYNPDYAAILQEVHQNNR